ncbi:AAA-like domain protein [Streptococcus intermedius]|uniref:ATP-binding protein n=1 Tax=Streptococcus intermedius TaxID=1338 RepID=UPI000F65D641|nr:ATP-binding protein [Streptococcus intermedius]RSJ17919.1 AAA-like domain protein [Streptococcus intermedius]
MTNESYVVGTVREIRGTNVVIRLFDNSSQMTYFFNGKRYSGIMIGSYIGIKRGHYTIVVKIEKEYAQDVLRDTTVQEFSKDRFFRELEAKVIGSFVREKYVSGMVAFPQIFNDVILLPNEQITAIISGESSGDNRPPSNPNSYFTIGEIWPEGIPYKVNWTTIFNTHIAIFGNTGSGKSNTLTRLYKNLFDLNKERVLTFGKSKFVVIDFNGEYVGERVLADDKKVYNLNTRKSEGDKIAIPANKFWDKEMLSILFGATAQTQQPFLNRLLKYYFLKNNFEENVLEYLCRAFRTVYSAPSKESLDLLKYALDVLGINHDSFSSWVDLSVFNPNNSNAYYSVQLLEGWNSSGSRWYFNADELIEILEHEIANIKQRTSIFMTSESNEKIQNPIIQLRLAAYFQMIFDLSRHTIQYDHISPLIHRIEARSSDFDKVLQVDNLQEDNFQEMFTEKNISVISLKNVNKDIKMLLPMLIAKISYDIHRTRFKQDSIFNLIIDEAHNILSENSTIESEKWKDYRLDVFEEIVKEGRKFGYYLTIASQRPSDISPTIVSQIHNYFIHRLVNDNDLKLLDRTMTSLDYISKSSIPNLSAGQAIITGVSFDLPVIVKITQLPEEEAPNSSNSELLKIWQVSKDK